MSQRQSQLKLVFSQSRRYPAQMKMSLASRSGRPRKKLRDSAFIEKMRTLERLSPEYAGVLEGIADGVFIEIFGAKLE